MSRLINEQNRKTLKLFSPVNALLKMTKLPIIDNCAECRCNTGIVSLSKEIIQV